MSLKRRIRYYINNFIKIICNLKQKNFMKIAYIDHSYHKKTLSNHDVLFTLLQKRGHDLVYFWDDSWQGGDQISFQEVLHFDAIIMFQQRCSIPQKKHFSDFHQNVTFVPMLDQFINKDTSNNFFDDFLGSKVLSFSTIVHGIAKTYGINSFLVRYYQPPKPNFLCPQHDLHGFLWLRHPEQVSWPLVRTLIGTTNFNSLHLHIAPDPETKPPLLPSREEISRYNITTSTWFKNKKNFNSILDKANVFFAPRISEGIGQSFLEAFTRGQCVVAPNCGTMNEYILHNVNGILYNPNKPMAVDFSHTHSLGISGKYAAESGYANWLSQQDEMIDFILTPNYKKSSIELYSNSSEVQNISSPHEQNFNYIKNRLTCSEISWEAVTWAYRLLYEREPESPEAILQHARASNQWEMVQHILNSEEYKIKINTNTSSYNVNNFIFNMDYPYLTEEFITCLYKIILRRIPKNEEISNFINTKYTKWELVFFILNSQEYKDNFYVEYACKNDIFINLPQLIFLHIAKVFGSSFINVLKENYYSKFARIYDEHFFSSDNRLLNAKSIGGHIRYSQICKKLKNSLYITAVREPCSRAFSLFQHWRSCPDFAPLKSGEPRTYPWYFNENSLMDTLQKSTVAQNFLDNDQCHVISGHRTFDAVCEVWEKENFIIGCFDYPQDFIEICASLLNWNNKTLPKINISTKLNYSKNISMEKGINELLIERNQEDMKLYNYVKSKKIISTIKDGFDLSVFYP